MKRYIMSIVQVSAQFLAIIFLFIPGMYTWRSLSSGRDMRIAMSLFEVPFYKTSPVPVFLLIILILCMLVGLAVLILNFPYRFIKFIKKPAFCTHPAFFSIPVLQTVLFIVITIFTCQYWAENIRSGYWYYHNRGDVSVLFFFEIVLMAAVMALDVFRLFVRKRKEAQPDILETAETIEMPPTDQEKTTEDGDAEEQAADTEIEAPAEVVAEGTLTNDVKEENSKEDDNAEVSDAIETEVAVSAQQSDATRSVSSDVQMSVIAELERYKELFDKGVITAEEFEAKKKQLLNI